MQVSLETLSGLERRLTVGIPAEVVDSEVNKRLQEASKTIRLNGFRKGKVPMKIVKQRYGAGVRQEVLGDAINNSFADAVQKESVRPAGQPSIEPKQMAAGKDIEYIATFEVYPEIELTSIDGVEIEKLNSEINDEDIDSMIEILRKSQANWEKVDRAAEDGDQVKIDFKGTKDGEAFDGGSAENQTLTLGSKSMIPGFEDGIVGMAVGETKTLALTFPEEYHAEELKGAAVEFEVTLNEVQGQILPELNDEFFSKFGVEEGGEEKFREDVKKNMENEKNKAQSTQLKTAVFDALIKANEVEVPKALVANEINVLRNQTMQQYGQLSDKIDPRAILPDDMFTEEAKRRTILGLLVSEVVAKEQVKVDGDRVKEMVENIASTYEDPESVVNYYYGNEQMLQSIQAAVLEDQVVDILADKANIVEKSVSYQELIRQKSGEEEASE